MKPCQLDWWKLVLWEKICSVIEKISVPIEKQECPVELSTACRHGTLLTTWDLGIKAMIGAVQMVNISGYTVVSNLHDCELLSLFVAKMSLPINVLLGRTVLALENRLLLYWEWEVGSLLGMVLHKRWLSFGEHFCKENLVRPSLYWLQMLLG